MKKTILSLMSFIIAAGISVKAAVNADTSIYVNAVKHTLSVSLPADYDPLKSYPLVIGLHFCGSNSNDYRDALKPLCDSLDVIVACPDNNGDWMNSPDFVLASIDTAKSIFNINENEIMLTGGSCNGKKLLDYALGGSYPVKGIFPWEPWVPNFESSTFNLDYKTPTVIAVGTADPNYGVLLSLYDSLKNHGAKVDLVLVPGVDHSFNFAEYSNTMIRCVNYISDTNAIIIDPIENFEIYNNEPPKEIKIRIRHKAGKPITINALSSYTSICKNPEISTIENDTVIVKITPIASKVATIRFLLEAAEVGGSAVEQVVFKVKFRAPPVAIHQTGSNPDFEVYPVPSGDFISIKCLERVISVCIIDTNGKNIYMDENFDTANSIDVSKFVKGNYFIIAKSPTLNEVAGFVVN
jgi:hypothetical protein